MGLGVAETVSRRRILTSIGGVVTTASVSTGSAIFSTEPLPKNPPTVIGHRGAAGLAPPNTRAAIEKAIEFESDGVELDVRQTRDGELVLFHDPVLDISTDKHGIVHKTPADVILDAEVHGHTVMTLDDGLELVRNADLDLHLELKRPGYATDVFTTVKESHLEEKTTIVSFETEPLTTMNTVETNVDLGLLGSAPIPTVIEDAVDLGVDTVLTHYVPHATPRFIEKAKSANLTAGIWSLVDTKHSIRDALEANPDILTTNRPDIVLSLLTQ